MRRRSQIFTPATPLVASLLVLLGIQLALLGWTIARPGVLDLPAPFADPRLLGGFQLIALFATFVLVWRTLLYRRYRALEGAPDAELPTITVIVPAYNEGEQVLTTVRSLMASDYPLAKLKIITIDDGSVDDTWSWIQQSAAEFPDHVVALRCAENRGKREALYEGFGRATGDVLVTVDSDSEVLPDALRNLVTPFVRDARVGAVAGNVRVLNRGDGALPAMMDVVFTSSFEFIRSTQSEIGTVLCCPGALSAYRRSLVDEFKDEWVRQAFCGTPSTIGEDRAMTNLVIERGYTVPFQANAIVVTKVPAHTKQLAKMFLRWARSDVRESLVLARLLGRRMRLADLGIWINLVSSSLALVLAPIAFVWLFGAMLVAPAVLPYVGIGIVLTSAFPALVYAFHRERRDAWWAFAYSAYSLICLSWIQPYALFTPAKAKWLTRTLPVAQQR